ncbi:adenylyl-sulfate kinase [Streptomyces sp. NBC_00669]|uniref:adenylyl-sulfate kinase n=1 Tax=Streptomyces sp. NBC_00669 TaxID=2976011 RepID=UPI003FA7DCA5
MRTPPDAAARSRTGPTATGPTATGPTATEPTTIEPETTEPTTTESTNQEDRMSGGATVWLTGLPSAGKTTIATALAEQLRAEGRRVEVLDGDEIREFLSAGLGFTREDRHTNVQRIGFVAELLASHGVLVLVPVIAPYSDSREAVRKRHQSRGTDYVEVHIATPVDVCAVRDVKGLYAKQAAGELTGLTGVDDPYEVPQHPDLRIETQGSSVAQSAAAVYAYLGDSGRIASERGRA